MTKRARYVLQPCLAAPCADTPLVDVADIATAHCLAMVLPEAKGRYIIWSTTVLATELAAMLRCVCCAS